MAASRECAFRGINTTPSPAFTAFTSKRTLKCQKCHLLLSIVTGERVGDSELLCKSQTVSFLLPVYPCSPFHRRPTIPTAMRTRAALLSAPIALCTLLPALDQSLFPSLTNVSRNPSANRWPRLSIIWNNL